MQPVSQATRKKIGAAHKNKKVSHETRLKMSMAAQKRKRHPCSEETKKKIRAALTNPSEEIREKYRQAAKRRTPEMIKKAALARGSWSLESRQKLSKSNQGKTRTEQQRKNISNSLLGRTLSKEHVKNIGLAQVGKIRGPMKQSTKAKLRENTLKQLATQNGPWKNTGIEVDLQEELTKRGIQFVTQKNICGYPVDIFIPSHNMVVEADGCRYHCCRECKCGRSWPQERIDKCHQYDERRDTLMIQSGYDVHRFWGHEILKSPSDCINRLCLEY